jgi:antirestriction protein ArdC
MLWSAAVAKGYSAPLWFTFRQARELGAHVRKGETGELVVYADRITRAETDAKGEAVEREIPFLKGYTVFNAEQIEGLPAHAHAKPEPPALTLPERIDGYLDLSDAHIRAAEVWNASGCSPEAISQALRHHA